MTDWIAQTEALRYTSREGDRVKIDAPSNSLGRPFQGQEGTIEEFRPGWIVVRLDEGHPMRFRPDELLTL